MNIGGLISGALGGAARGFTQYAESEMKKQQEVDLNRQLLQAQEEKQLRIDEITRARDLADVPKLAEAQAQGQVIKTSTPGYLGSLSSEASAKESSATRASAAASSYELNRAKQIDALRTELSQTSDPAQRETLRQRLDDLFGALDSGSIGGKKDKPPTKDRLTTVLNSANATIRSLESNRPPKANRDAYSDWLEQLEDAKELRNTALRMLRENYPDAPAGGSSTPSTPPPKAPPPGATSSQSTNRPPIDSFFK